MKAFSRIKLWGVTYHEGNWTRERGKWRADWINWIFISWTDSIMMCVDVDWSLATRYQPAINRMMALHNYDVNVSSYFAFIPSFSHSPFISVPRDLSSLNCLLLSNGRKKLTAKNEIGEKKNVERPEKSTNRFKCERNCTWNEKYLSLSC